VTGAGRRFAPSPGHGIGTPANPHEYREPLMGIMGEVGARSVLAPPFFRWGRPEHGGNLVPI
jgi:hypothetical protein